MAVSPKVRRFSSELPPELYLKLEMAAFDRNTTPYRLVSDVMAAFLSGRLVPQQRSPSSPCPSPSPSVAPDGQR